MKWHDVACPTCRARSGDFCSVDGDVRQPQHDPHPERVQRASAEAERDVLRARLATVEAHVETFSGDMSAAAYLTLTQALRGES